MTCCFCGDLCHKSLCLNKKVIEKRIRNEFSLASSLRTMQMSACCVVEKNKKLASYDRVIRRLKQC